MIRASASEPGARVIAPGLWSGFTTAGWRFGETRPPIFGELEDDALYDKLTAAVRDKEQEFQAGLRAKGRRFMGQRKLGKQDWKRAAVSFEERFGVTPKVAASSKWQRLAQLQRDREWEREYAAARALWRAGEPAVFPAGTYWLRRFVGGAVVEQPP